MIQALKQNPAGGAITVLPRSLSLLLAAGLAGYIFINPKAVSQVSHGMLTLAMLGICAGFVHGVGFVPQTKMWRIVLGPWTAWPLMAIGLWLVLTG